MHARTAWQCNSVLSGVIGLNSSASAPLDRESALLSTVLSLCSLTRAALHLGKRMPPQRLHAQYVGTEETGQLQTHFLCKITHMQPSSNSHRNDGAMLLKVRLGSEPTTFSLKRRLWSLKLGVTVDQQTEPTADRAHISIRIITSTSSNSRIN